MIPGEIIPAEGEIELNAGQPTITIAVANSGDRPVQVGSHYHFYETNAALTFDRVLSVQTSRIRRDRPEAVLELLAIAFEPGEAPAGSVTLHFAGGGAIRLSVECIEAHLADLGTAWATRLKPSHDAAADKAGA